MNLIENPLVPISQYEFKGRRVRTITKDGEPWFVAKDVCDILEIENSRDAISTLDQEDRIVVTRSNVGNSDISLPNRGLQFVNESGLYDLIFVSRKPEARAFKRWVTKNVLPTIRRTGSFNGRIPNSTELAKMVIERDRQLGIAGEIFDKVLPTAPYGEPAPNGQPRLGIRRAAFVAARNRLTEAVQIIKLTSQLELHLLQQ